MNYQLFCPNNNCAVRSFHELFYPDYIDRECPKCSTQGIAITIGNGIVVDVRTTKNETLVNGISQRT